MTRDQRDDSSAQASGGKPKDKAAAKERSLRLRRLYLRLTKPAHPLMVRGAVFAALSVAFDFVPYVIAILIAQDALRSTLPDAPTLVALVAAAIICAAIGRCCFGKGVGTCHRADADFRVGARHILLDHFARLPLGWFNDSSSSEVKQAVSDDVLGMHQSVGHAPAEMTGALLTPLIPLVFLFFVDWRLSLLFVAYLAVVIAVSMVFMFRDHSKLKEEYNAANIELSSSVVEMIEGIEVVKTFGSAKHASERFRQAVERLTEIIYVWTKLSAGPFSMLVAFISPGIILALLGVTSVWFIASGWIDFAACVPFLVLGPSIPSGFVTVGSSMNFLNIAVQGLGHVDQILAVKPLPEPVSPQALADADLDVAFDDVSFAYSESDDAPRALEGVEAHLMPGTVSALVGDSGSGKTTFARLIPRFWDPSTGVVGLGGHDLRTLASASVLSKVAVVFQESMMLSLSIRDNIKLARPEATDDEMVQAAKAAQIHDRISEFPRGYDTVIGSSEGDLSGGEAQRVAIARAIVQDAPILVLDEATAHTDPENEGAIQVALGNLSRGRTTVVIAHRLNTIAQADQILVMEAGRIVERGVHDDLLARGGRYAYLWKAQQVSGLGIEGTKEENR